jgi:hypothetical protein
MKISANVNASAFAGVMRRVARLVTERAARASRAPKPPRTADQTKEPGR